MSRICRVRRRSRGQAPERGERPRAAEVGGSEQTPVGALHHRRLGEGLAGAKSQGTPGQAPSSPHPTEYHQLSTGQRRRARWQDATSPGTPSPTEVLTPPPVLTVLRGGDAAQPPRRAASASAGGAGGGAPDSATRGALAPPAGGEEEAPAAPPSQRAGEGDACRPGGPSGAKPRGATSTFS